MISSAMTVAEVLERHPETLDVFRLRGFRALANPFLRRTFAHLITIEGACARHHVPLAPFLAELNAVAATGLDPAPVPEVSPIQLVPAESIAVPDSDAAGGPVRASMNVEETVSRFPETRTVFARLFGEGCFTCPSFGAEDVRFACGMHGADVVAFVEACNAAVAAAREPGLEDMTIDEILRRHPEAAPVLNRFGLDACCGGAKRLSEAAAAHRVDPRMLAAEVRSILHAPPTRVEV